jgi:hypothetical protein
VIVNGVQADVEFLSQLGRAHGAIDKVVKNLHLAFSEMKIASI